MPTRNYQEITVSWLVRGRRSLPLARALGFARVFEAGVYRGSAALRGVSPKRSVGVQLRNETIDSIGAPTFASDVNIQCPLWIAAVAGGVVAAGLENDCRTNSCPEPSAKACMGEIKDWTELFNATPIRQVGTTHVLCTDC